MKKQIASWQGAITRYDSDPKDNDGRKEIMARTKSVEENRKVQKAKGNIYDISSALFQIGIVLASAIIITGMIALAWLALALGAGGLILLGFAFGTVVTRSIPFTRFQTKSSRTIAGACLGKATVTHQTHM